jgi:anhydro-N-acetylmuramic acid kinase
MNPQIKKLYQISQKEDRLIIGLMSGTSLDGLDVALCRFNNSGSKTTVELVAFETIPYSENIKSEIRKVFAEKSVNLPFLCMLNPYIGNLHAEMVNQCLNKWGIPSSTIDIIASHGQTVMHQPIRMHKNKAFPNSTLQIGDGDHIAKRTGIVTLSDFRQKHCASGGEGAPLALYGDFLLFSSRLENRILINIGGIANYTNLPKGGQFEGVFATDTGPGNTMMDAFVNKHFNVSYDKDALIAKAGQPNLQLLNKLKSNCYFQEAVPKTTGPELFNMDYLNNAIAACHIIINKSDILATLCQFSAETLCDSIKSSVNTAQGATIYLSGGGMHNPLLVSLIKQNLLGLIVKPMDDLGISGDAKEAVLFAALANETVAGKEGFQINGQHFSMGKISLPQ